MLLSIALMAALGLVSGCGVAPQAPALENGPVFKNSREGFRFLVPDGWIQYARGEVPSSPVNTECMLVEYELHTGDRPAKLAVTRIDLADEHADLGEYVLKHPGDQGWRYQTAPRFVPINGVNARQIKLDGYLGGKERWTREVYAFRRGERVYLFSGTYLATDARAQREIMRALESVIWDR
ncbi:MAG TPA: hypothetical protein VGY66_31835 [Gemmataceae bacterium]|jgi:hypothetical protein|nr:hypothetical protein [Gemmataceae bacterium]